MIIRGGRIALVLLTAAVAWSPAASGEQIGPAASPPPVAPGYLAKGAAPDALAILPPPPKHGSAAEAEDQAAFVSTRSLQGTPRWKMATNDAVISTQSAYQDYACALGVTLETAQTPTLSTLLVRVATDARPVIDPPKDYYARPRPFLDLKGPICVEDTSFLRAAASYPSGHATLGWTWGLILAELAPDRSTQILSRARVYGESRVVCGVHYPSDIEAGRTNGSTLFAVLQSDPAFRADMETARAEIAAARKAGGGIKPDPEQCKLEKDTAATRPW